MSSLTNIASPTRLEDCVDSQYLSSINGGAQWKSLVDLDLVEKLLKSSKQELAVALTSRDKLEREIAALILKRDESYPNGNEEK